METPVLTCMWKSGKRKAFIEVKGVTLEGK